MRSAWWVKLGMVVALVGCKAPDEPHVRAVVAEPPPGPNAAPTATEPTSSTEECRGDADCVLSTFPGCCSCCQCGPVRAVTAAREAKDRARCKEVSCPCTSQGGCSPCVDPAKEGNRARCVASRCELVEVKGAKPSAPAARD